MMKQVVLVLLVVLLCGATKRWNEELSLTVKTYNLKGNVAFVSEKKMSSILGDDWNFSADMTECNCITNSSFDEVGNLIEIDCFDADSVFKYKSKIIRSWDDKYSKTEIYDKDGVETHFLSPVKNSVDRLEVKNYDLIERVLIAKEVTEYEDCMVKRHCVVYVKDGHRSESIFKRNSDGDVIEIVLIDEFAGRKDEIKWFVKYMNFDDRGNWTKRIHYNRSCGNDCEVVVRQIKYYD